MSEPRPNPTRQALIDEAIAGLHQLTPADLLSAVGIKEIAARAGVGVTTVYHHFGNLAGFAQAVVDQVFRVENIPVEVIHAHVQHIAGSTFPLEHSRAFHGAEFDRLTSDPGLRIRMGLWALGGGTTDQVYGDFLRGVDESLIAYCDAMFAVWGREMRPPFDMRAYVAAQVALLNGASIRALVDEGALDRERFARLAGSLSLMLARMIGDRRTLDDRMTELNFLPVHRIKGVDVGDQAQRTRNRILDAAAELFAGQGYAATTVPDVARVSGASKSTIYAQFDDIADIATHLLRVQAEEELVGAEAQPSGVDTLRHALHAIAQFLAVRGDYAGAYGSRLVAGTLLLPDPLVDLLAGAITRGQQGGELAQAHGADEVAEQLLLLLIARLTAHPGDGPAAAVERVEALVLPGLLAPAA